MASPADDQTVYRILTLFSKRPDLTDEQFSHHWEKVHAPIVMPWALKHGFIGYIQYHTPAAMREAFASVMASEWRGDIKYNGAAIFDIVSYEAFVKAFEDPYYINVIEPDERNFVAKDVTGKYQVLKAMSTMGVVKTIISGGKPQIEYEPKDI